MCHFLPGLRPVRIYKSEVTSPPGKAGVPGLKVILAVLPGLLTGIGFPRIINLAIRAAWGREFLPSRELRQGYTRRNRRALKRIYGKGRLKDLLWFCRFPAMRQR
jgi:hypothetical protein